MGNQLLTPAAAALVPAVALLLQLMLDRSYKMSGTDYTVLATLALVGFLWATQRGRYWLEKWHALKLARIKATEAASADPASMPPLTG